MACVCVAMQDDETRLVRQFHFTAWPDHGCPTYATSLIAFRKKVRSYDDPTAGPTVVHCRYDPTECSTLPLPPIIRQPLIIVLKHLPWHLCVFCCSAGVGRTGTFIALDYLLDMAKAEQKVDVYSFVQSMRTKRVNMVQTQVRHAH